jgi:hypothetical protein
LAVSVTSKPHVAAVMHHTKSTPAAFAGIAAVIASGALLLAGVGVVVPMMGLVAGVAAMLGASLDRLKLRACEGSRKDASGGYRCEGAPRPGVVRLTVGKSC